MSFSPVAASGRLTPRKMAPASCATMNGATVIDFRLRPKRLCYTDSDPLQCGLHGAQHLALHRAHCTAHAGRLRDDIAGVAAINLGDAQDTHVRWRQVTSNYRLERCANVTGGNDRIDRLIGPSAVCAPASHCDVEKCAACHCGARRDGEVA